MGGYTAFIAGPVEVTVTLYGDLLNQVIVAGPIEVNLSLLGNFYTGVMIVATPIEVTISLESSYFVVEASEGWEGDVSIAPVWMSNWVWWSKVGYADFTVDHSNLAGRRPMDWKGTVYEIIKLNDSVVVYGSNGITVMKPSERHWGMRTIQHIGITSKVAVVGTDTEHYFVDRQNELWKLSSEGLQRLNYSEFLSTLTIHRLTLDIETGLLYICDGEIGFVYSTRVGSFGLGPGDVTGLCPQSGELFVTTNAGIVYPKFSICTDIYDLGTRKPKTIQWIEVGTDLTVGLKAKIDTRNSNRDPFRQSTWVQVNPSGIAYIPCHGVEFKFRLRSYIDEYLELDYIKVVGVVHGSDYLDSLHEVV